MEISVLSGFEAKDLYCYTIWQKISGIWLTAPNSGIFQVDLKEKIIMTNLEQIFRSYSGSNLSYVLGIVPDLKRMKKVCEKR